MGCREKVVSTVSWRHVYGGQSVESTKESGCIIWAEVAKTEDVSKGAILQLNISYIYYCFVPLLNIVLLSSDLNFRIKYGALSLIPTVLIWLFLNVDLLLQYFPLLEYV